MLFQVTVPANNERGPRYAEKAFAALHQAKPRHPVTLVYGVREGQIGLFVRCDESDRETVIEPLRAGYPDSTVALVDDERSADVSLPSPRTTENHDRVGTTPDKQQTWYADIELVPELFPILRHAQFEDMLNCARESATACT